MPASVTSPDGFTVAIDEAFTLRKLEIFLAFMRLESLSRVAEAFDQSTVSVHRALHSLEEAVGCPLFRRVGRKLVPLATAHQLAESARRVVSECEDGIRQTRERAGILGDRLRLGAIYSLTLHCVPHLIVGTKLRKEGLQIDLTLGSNSELLDGLEHGKLDAVLIGMHEGIATQQLLRVPLFVDRMYLAVPLDSPLAGRDSVDLAALSDENFVTLKNGFITSQSFEQLIAKAGIAPRVTMHVGDIFSLINLISGGMGISLLPGRIGSFSSRIRLVPLAERYATFQHIELLYPKSREDDRNLRALAAEGRSYSRRLLDAVPAASLTPASAAGSATAPESSPPRPPCSTRT